MGSSCEANGKVIDPSVGGLVWVRRRNGSWWPGRILGPDELPDSCLVSPRSGTPVKLLGREDASVDWYNLEKSKRVKAFRCGEYDDCIEKAKASASVSCKKAVKYARREDAILHALELESARSSKNCHATSSHINKSSRKHPDEETEGVSDKLSGLEYNSNSPPEGVSFEEPCRTNGLIDQSLQGGRQRTPNDSEDDGTDGLTDGSKKRMRGLEDLGVGGTLSVKRRRSQAAHVHDFLKKKNRRRQLTKVLESTAMVTVPVMCEEVNVPAGSFVPGGSDNKSFSVVINNNSDSTGDASNNPNISPINCKQKGNEISSVSKLLENDSSVKLFDVPFVGEEKPTADVPPILVSEKPQSGQSSLVETVSVGNDEIQESGSISSGAAGNIEKGASKWQLKGKRNSRNKNKTTQKLIKDDEPNADLESYPVEVTAPQRSLPYRQSRFTVNPKYQSSDLAYTKHDMGTLYDVNIEVQSSHRPQYVPYISLMSKSTGQPITGHPLLVEVLDDLSLNGSECYSSSCELDGDVGLVQEAKKPRRNGLLSNKKIRKLSALTGSKRPNEPEKPNGPVVACVPLKVVFSRLKEALGVGLTQPVHHAGSDRTR